MIGVREKYVEKSAITTNVLLKKRVYFEIFLYEKKGLLKSSPDIPRAERRRVNLFTEKICCVSSE